MHKNHEVKQVKEISIKNKETRNNLKKEDNKSEFIFIYDQKLKEMIIEKTKSFNEFQIKTKKLLEKIDSYLK